MSTNQRTRGGAEARSRKLARSAAPPNFLPQDVLSDGFLADAIMEDGAVNPEFLREAGLANALRTAAVQDLIVAVEDAAATRDDFMVAFGRELHRAASVQAVADLLRGIEAAEHMFKIRHPLGLGVIALHLWSTRARVPSAP